MEKSSVDKVANRTIHRWRRILFDPLAWILSRRELRRLMRQAGSPDQVIAVTHQYAGRGFYAALRPVQNNAEITRLAQRFYDQNPRIVVEIGTFKGGTLFMWCRLSRRAETVVSIDLPQGFYGGGYEPRRVKLYREFLYDRPGTKLALMRRDSHDPETLRALEAILAGRNLDFLYIDGDHTYEGCKNDFELYAPLVREGMVVFHDILTRTANCGVYQLWEELKNRYPTEEILAPGSGKGIGVLHKR